MYILTYTYMFSNVYINKDIVIYVNMYIYTDLHIYIKRESFGWRDRVVSAARKRLRDAFPFVANLVVPLDQNLS